MTAKLTLYTRRDCCLCAEMKAVIQVVAADLPLELDEIDVDRSSELRGQFGDHVPVLFIDGRKAFKYRVTAAALGKRLTRQRPPLLARLTRAFGR
jgi:glutaredoxin